MLGIVSKICPVVVSELKLLNKLILAEIIIRENKSLLISFNPLIATKPNLEMTP